MGKQQGQQKKANRFKKQFNNDNPYNKLQLNKFHQVENSKNPKYGHHLHKRKRDLERMIAYRKNKGLEIQEEKVKEIEEIENQMSERKGVFEKDKRKQFFIGEKYKQIMNIEKRKIAQKLRQINSQNPINHIDLAEWLKKLNYVKFYPKTLKYVSLFPTTPLSEKGKIFQEKIMNEIDLQQSKKRQKLNKFQSQYKPSSKQKKPKDDFFLIQNQQEQLAEIEQQQQQEEEE